MPQPADGSDRTAAAAAAEEPVGAVGLEPRHAGSGRHLELEEGVVYHAYSAYSRGLDGLWGTYLWLDRAPLGRSETGLWWRRHEEYEAD